MYISKSTEVPSDKMKGRIAGGGRRKKGSGKMVGMTQISISLPESLVQQIDELAKMDNRNRSNFIANTLQNLAREQLTVAEAKKKIK